jgi:hypothetical protein
MDLILPGGTIVLPSVRGHYNFFYPDSANPLVLPNDTEIMPLTWLGYNGLKAVQVSSEVALEHGLSHPHVWINEELL